MKHIIKFRGRHIATDGKMVYGDLIHVKGKPVIFGDTCEEVDPDSIAQLVGYDKAGNEMYTGDTVTDSRGTFTLGLQIYWKRQGGSQ